MFNMGTTVRDCAASCSGATIGEGLGVDPVALDQIRLVRIWSMLRRMAKI